MRILFHKTQNCLACQQLTLFWYATGEIKHRTALTSRNLTQRALLWWQLEMKCSRQTTNLRFILLDMIRSRKFFPGPGWVASNGGGMDMERVNSLWRTITFPEDTTLHDIDNIFFCRDGATSRNSRYFHDSQDSDRPGEFFSRNGPADFVRLPP